MPSIKPPQAPPLWTHSPSDIIRITQEAIDKSTAVQDALAKLSPEECNFTSVFQALADADTALALAETILFYQNVSPRKDLRDASNDAEVKMNSYGVDAEMRLDVFAAKKAALANIKASGVQLSKEEQRLVDRMMRDGVRAGLDLPDDKREELLRMKKELSQLCTEFNKNFNEENGKVSFTLKELEGVPADVVSGYPKRTEGDKELYDVTHKTPDIFPIFKTASNPETRKRAYESYEARLAVNVPLLERVLELRRQIAVLLAYPTWADYITEVKMVKDAKNVTQFLNDLEQKLRPVGMKEREVLLGMKKAEHDERGLPFDGEFYVWDYRYYDQKFIEKHLTLDDNIVKEYFPVSVVVPTILDIYQHLLGVRFEELKMEEGELWHPEVQQFAVWENDAKDGSGFVGYCYLDLFPRAAKYGHAAVWPLIPGYDIPSSDASGKPNRNYPVAAMVANLAKPTPDRPALMRHDDVVTFFHEMGHVFHGLLSRTRFARFHGTNVARDFVEAPSQMLENWCWEPKVLEKMSSHYKTKEHLPADMIEKIIKSRYVNVGLFYLRQLFFAKFDIKVHTDQDATDYTKLWNDLRTSVSLVEGGDKPGPGQAAFSHITGSYDAGYYGYTYSLVFAADMYRTIFKKDPLDPKLGQRYREKILVPGGSRDESESLEDFLGRPPDANAFLDEVLSSETDQTARI